ncbi:hypothetical protein [Bacillus sp. ISL-45]|uniref:hypothetical protein n=1 Tax=Bacillus sp. ISL-45 TaxID=2819128 RepID=UPI001BE9CAB8|nr:hypothetical protein [Bacillus sp. ISL-45]MBT2639540.1 hypothetical protein [Bacillus sp. ISL-39]
MKVYNNCENQEQRLSELTKTHGISKWNIMVDIELFIKLYCELMIFEGNGKEPMKY